MRLVTTCNAAGFERYGRRLLESLHNLPHDAEVWWYTEGFTLPETPGVVQISTDKLQGLQAFKLRHLRYQPPTYLYDAVRFSHKVFAACDALADYDGVGVWIDADCVIRKPIPAGFLESHLHGHYMAMLKRRGLYTETGLWLMDCAHEQHKEFLLAWQEWYLSDAFKQLANWTDCETLDATVRLFERQGLITTASLSGEHDKDMHPLAKVPLGAFIDHCKGERKDLGYSPEAQ